jgi:hypothetical protein
MKRRSLVLWLVSLLAVMSLVSVAAYARHRTGGTTEGVSASGTTRGEAASGTTRGEAASGTTRGEAASGTTEEGDPSGSGGGGASGSGGGASGSGGGASGSGSGGASGSRRGGASGSGSGGASGSRSGGASGGESGGASGSDEGGNFGGGGGGPSVTTELDLGQGFAEDPFFEGELEPFALYVSSDRFDLSAIPLTFTLTNRTASDVTNVQFVVTFTVLEGDVMPAPGQDLVRAVTAAQGSCEESDSSPSTTRVSCQLGTIPTSSSANVRVVISGAFRLSVAMGLEVGEG